MTDLTLYDDPLDDQCYKVRLLLSLMGLSAKTIPIDANPGREHQGPAFLAINPLGTLPVLRDGATTLRDPQAILAYLAYRHDPARTWMPTDPVAFGEVAMWLAFAGGPLAAATTARAIDIFGAPGDGAAARKTAKAALRIIDDHMTLRGLDGAAWFVGNLPTVADVALLPAFALSRDFGLDHEAFPALRLWLRRMRKLQGFITMAGIPDYH